jgi:hypothetical protein
MLMFEASERLSKQIEETLPVLAPVTKGPEEVDRGILAPVQHALDD